MTEILQTNREILGKEIQRLIQPDIAGNFIKATDFLLDDAPPKDVDAVFFHGRSFFDAEKKGIFTLAADLIKQGRARYILIADSEGERVGGTMPREAGPGKSLWVDRLTNLGVDQDRILFSPHPDSKERGFNTKTEAEAFLATAKEKGFTSAIVLTQPHQIVRAMLGAIRAINQKGLQFYVWCMCPQTTDWNRRVKGSQGMERKPRIKHIQDEIERVISYQEKGDIAGFDELFAYLTKRDNPQNSS